MVKIGKKKSVQRKKSHIKVNQKVFFPSVKWKETEEKKNTKQITSEIITLPTKMKTEKKWTNHETHSHPPTHIYIHIQWYSECNRKENLWRGKVFNVCALFRSISFSLTHSPTHTIRSYLWCALIEMKRFARLFQVVMAVATTMNEHNNVKKTQAIFV